MKPSIDEQIEAVAKRIAELEVALRRARPHVAFTKTVAKGELYATCYMDLLAVDEALGLEPSK